MNSGQPLPPRKIQVNPSAENSGQPLEWIQANLLQILNPSKIKANSSTEN